MTKINSPLIHKKQFIHVIEVYWVLLGPLWPLLRDAGGFWDLKKVMIIL
jgi:hypothetical protein